MDEIILSSLTSKCVLSKQPEGLVYLIDSPYEGGKKVVVKSRNVSMKHEYKVGLALNEFIKAHELGRYFVKTLDYFERNEKTYLVTEYAAGESPTEENIKEVAGELFYVLQELQYTLRFTHYGLYLGNYIAFKRETPVEINLPHLGKRFESTYSIKIIDYGYSHFGGTLDESIPAVEVTTVETNLYRLTLGKISDHSRPLLRSCEFDSGCPLLQQTKKRRPD